MSIVSRIAAIFAIPLLISTIYLNQKSNRLQSEYSIQASTASVINTIKSPMGAKTQVVLPDGSNVWLNSGSSLSYPSRFDAKSRNVELTGEAFFEVVKNEKTPMLVSAGGIQVKVYGTKFNLNAYVGGKEIKTALVEGKVSLIVNGSTKENFLKPGYAALFNCNKRILEIKKIGDIDEFIGWKDGKLLFRDEKFVNILEKLERWYNVEIHLSDKTLEHYALYATFFDENIEQVLNILASSLPIEVEYPKRVKLSDGTYSKRKIIIKRDTKRKMTIN
jgi:ferric-dicitrate binding protein FerR (iron transport regulator)